jgi:hypothetical protein
MPGCETNFLGAVICDGPIRPGRHIPALLAQPGQLHRRPISVVFRADHQLPNLERCQWAVAGGGIWPGPPHRLDEPGR